MRELGDIQAVISIYRNENHVVQRLGHYIAPWNYSLYNIFSHLVTQYILHPSKTHSFLFLCMHKCLYKTESSFEKCVEYCLNTLRIWGPSLLIYQISRGFCKWAMNLLQSELLHVNYSICAFAEISHSALALLSVSKELRGLTTNASYVISVSLAGMMWLKNFISGPLTKTRKGGI